MSPHRTPDAMWRRTRPEWAAQATWDTIRDDMVLDPGTAARVDTWAQNPERAPVLYLAGPPGTGKTHLAVALASRAVDRGIVALFVRHTDVINLPRFGPRADELNQYLTCRLLVLDDLCVAPLNDHTAAVTDQIINTRADRGRPTIITSNLRAGADLDAHVGARLASRSVGWEIVEVLGPDRRRHTNTGKDGPA